MGGGDVRLASRGGRMAQPVREDSGDVLARNLRKTNWTVDLAENGRAALGRLAQARPDVILLDLSLPVMDGFSFLEHKRENDGWDAIPVIVVTATTLSAEERRRLNGGIEAVLTKGSLNIDGLLAELGQRIGGIASRLADEA